MIDDGDDDMDDDIDDDNYVNGDNGNDDDNDDDEGKMHWQNLASISFPCKRHFLWSEKEVNHPSQLCRRSFSNSRHRNYFSDFVNHISRFL